MRRIKKYKGESSSDSIKERLSNYSLISKGIRKGIGIQNTNFITRSNKTLYSLTALAAATMSPILADAQCLVSSYGIDLDGDMQADLQIYPTFLFSGYSGNNVSVYQWRAVAMGTNTVMFPGSGAGIPRLCYLGTCLFPYANGQTSNPAAIGSIGVLLSSVNTCFYNFTSTQICNTSTTTVSTTYGGTYPSYFTTCYTTFLTSTTCLPTINRGNFAPGVQGTLAVSLNGGAYQFIELTINGGNNNQMVQTIDGQPAIACSLTPVEFISFDIKVLESSIKLDWSTATETNNFGFELQRSSDGENFEVIQWINGQGNTSTRTDYQYEDKNLERNTLYYYRLKQIDYDAAFDYSVIVSGKLEDNRSVTVSHFFPNPAPNQGFAAINIFVEKTQHLQIDIFDAKGILIHNQHSEVNAGQQRLEIPLSSFPKGSFFAKLQFEDGTIIYEKLIVAAE